MINEEKSRELTEEDKLLITNKNQINAITQSYKKYNNVLDNYISECDPFCTIYKPKNYKPYK